MNLEEKQRQLLDHCLIFIPSSLEFKELMLSYKNVVKIYRENVYFIIKHIKKLFFKLYACSVEKI